MSRLGRGTSTYDGVAIAYATLSHLAGIGCNTLFVTHYPTMAEELAKEVSGIVLRCVMSMEMGNSADGSIPPKSVTGI
jgi:DNA mismatch repair protein MSH3